jgi:DNA topoisomerase I
MPRTAPKARRAARTDVASKPAAARRGGRRHAAIRAADPPHPAHEAAAAGLAYVNDEGPGIRRVRSGSGFRYEDAAGARVRDEATLRRIRALAIPPAWKEVWICPSAEGHIQATGRDARGRKQYRYHARWREKRDETKYHRMIAFAKALPLIRERTAADLARPGLPREKVLAAVVRLLESTLIRVGNEEYARTNESFGLTTMQDRHVEIEGSKVRFEFRGKSGVVHAVDLQDKRLARIVKQCQDVPGAELFQYIDDDGQRHAIGSSDVNGYLHDIVGNGFTAKDFRTWAGTVLAAAALQQFESFDSQTQAKRNIVQAIESVAKRLGNTKAVCRKCYVHPLVFDAYLDGSLARTLKLQVEKEIRGSLAHLRPEEAAVLAFLEVRLARDARAAAVPLERTLRRSVRAARRPGRAARAA